MLTFYKLVAILSGIGSILKFVIIRREYDIWMKITKRENIIFGVQLSENNVVDLIVEYNK